MTAVKHATHRHQICLPVIKYVCVFSLYSASTLEKTAFPKWEACVASGTVNENAVPVNKTATDKQRAN